MGLSKFEQRLAVYTCEGPGSLSIGEPVLLPDRESAVLPFAEFHDRSGIFAIDEQSLVLDQVIVPANCLKNLSSFSPYSPGEEKYLALDQTEIDLETFGYIEFSQDAPATYIIMRKDGTFEIGFHSDDRVDNSIHPGHYKFEGNLFVNGALIVAKGESRSSAELKNFYFTAIRDGKGNVEIFGAKNLIRDQSNRSKME